MSHGGVSGGDSGARHARFFGRGQGRCGGGKLALLPGAQFLCVGGQLFLIHIENAPGTAAVAALVIAWPDRRLRRWIVGEGGAAHDGGK